MTRWAIGAVAAALMTFAAAGISGATDAKVGKELHDAKCLKCHGTEAYTSAKRKIKSLTALKTMVGRCAGAAKADWTDAQKADVTDYLNESFFHY